MSYPTFTQYIPTYCKQHFKMDSEKFATMIIERAEIEDNSSLHGGFCPFLNITTIGGSSYLKGVDVTVRDLSLRLIIYSQSFRDNDELGYFFRIDKELPRGLKRLHAKGKLIPLLKAHMLL